jgi:hypothetical protein
MAISLAIGEPVAAWTSKNVPDDLEAARHVIERLSHLVADLAQRAAATGTGARCGMPQILSGQMFRQRTPSRLLCLDRGLDCCGHFRRCRRELLCPVALQRSSRT